MRAVVLTGYCESQVLTGYCESQVLTGYCERGGPNRVL